MSELFVDAPAAAAAADVVRAAGSNGTPALSAVDAGSPSATDALAALAAAVTAFHESFVVQTQVVATAVSLGVRDVLVADGSPQL